MNGIDGLATVEDAFVSLLDIAPTFCELAGADIPDTYDGRSLLELADGTADWREHARGEFHGHQFAYQQRMIREDRYKLVLNAFDTNEFYDLRQDPSELDNRIGDSTYGSTVERLYDRLMAELRAEDDPFVTGPTRKLSKTRDIELEEYE